jgi:hypothetical protein
VSFCLTARTLWPAKQKRTMSRRPHRNTPGFKAKVALAAIKGAVAATGSAMFKAWSVLPGVDHDDAGALEISDVARHHGQAVDKRRGGDQRVDLVAPVRDMQMRAAGGDGIVDGEDATGEPGADMIVEPGARPARRRDAGCRARRVPVRGW